MTTKPKVALVVDRPNWAFAFKAAALAETLTNRYEFQIIPVSDLGQLWRLPLAFKGADLVHFFWRGHLHAMLQPDFRAEVALSLGSWEAYARRYLSGVRFSTGVYDHLLLDDRGIEEYRSVFSNAVVAYSVTSERLNRIYKALASYPSPVSVVENGVDLRLFRPQRLERLTQTRGRPIVLGWAGNSLWGGGPDDPKGFHSILLPAVEQLTQAGEHFELVVADRLTGQLPREQMPAFYDRLDVFICTSTTEGTPNPVLEAMACGIPVVSTDVGVVREAFGPRQSEFVMGERSIEALSDSLLRLVRNPGLLPGLSNENLRSVRAWDWSIKAEDFAAFLEHCLGQTPVMQW